MTPDQLREWNATRPFPHPNEAQEIIFEGHRCVVMDPECYEECFKQAESHAAALEEIERLKEAVELLYDKWENGEDCHEISGDEMGVVLGKAFQLSREEEDAILALLKGIPSPAPMQVLAQRAEQAERRAERLQAKVDSLMLEYCPDEMTPEQLAEWEKHQRAVPAERRAERLKVHAEESHSLLIRAMAYTPTDCSLFDDMHKRLKAYRADKGE